MQLLLLQSYLLFHLPYILCHSNSDTVVKINASYVCLYFYLVTLPKIFQTPCLSKNLLLNDHLFFEVFSCSPQP